MKLLIPTHLALGIAAGSVLLLTSCNEEVKQEAKAPQKNSISINPLKNAYYGDLHLHTTLSFDAYLFGTNVTPEEAYKYAKGETIQFFGKPVKKDIPLDFLAVTDHSENLSVFNQLDDTTSALYKSPLGQQLKDRSIGNFLKYVTAAIKSGSPSFQVPNANEKVRAGWEREKKAANDAYVPGKFTTLIGYEWTSMPGGANLHRNVIFKNEGSELPFSSNDSKKPEDLWTFLETNRKAGIEVLAIPHNANASNGLMYDWNDSEGKPIDKTYASRRIANEPVNEISQNKGQSETHPSLSPADEFAGFEVFDRLLLGGDSKVSGSYVREAYGKGLAIQEKTGVNPFKFGVIGSTDIHSGLSETDEKKYAATFTPRPDPKTGVTKPDALKNFFSGSGFSKAANLFGSGNLAGVWAEQNTREAIFEALKRKEVFATSGTRLQFRLFGGWNYEGGLQKNPDWVKTAYANGVPMGGDLPARPANAKAPVFAAEAVKDPNGANLDRLQIVKVWSKEGKQFEKIFNVALSNSRTAGADGKAAPVGNSVDLTTASYKNTLGAVSLRSVWSDPEFDENQQALYYLRVIEIPTPRWSTILAVSAGLPLPKDLPSTVQERGWSSPIWYTPQK